MIELIIAALATYGVSKLLVEYDGFGNIFYRLRDISWLKMLTCVVCTGTWVGIIFGIVYLLGYGVYLAPLAIIGIVILIEEFKK